MSINMEPVQKWGHKALFVWGLNMDQSPCPDQRLHVPITPFIKSTPVGGFKYQV